MDIITRLNLFVVKTYGHGVTVKKISLCKKDYEELLAEYSKRGIDVSDGVKFLGIEVENNGAQT